MRFLLATDDLVLQGRSFAGFPLLLDDDGDAMEPAQTYLWHLLGRAGRIASKKTWEKYGRDIYDYFAFIYANNIDWKVRPSSGLPGPLERYIEWSKGTLDLDTKTINGRVRLALRFYRWALKNQLVDAVPFDEVVVHTSHDATFFAHLDAGASETISADVLLREQKPVIKLITKEQIKVCLGALTNPTHRLMFEVMTRSGLRQEEVRTFPESYVFDPARRRDLVAGQMVMIDLDPAGMKIKGDKPRTIEIPYSLMEDLWWWSVRQRPAREANHAGGIKFKTLFLTEAGCPYGDSALTSIFDRLKRNVGFHVTPHMCRHTYATYRLRSLKNSKTFEGEPLLYIMDRLGHSSVLTTKVYLKLINQLDGQLVLQHEDELDDLFYRRAA
ncbi:MULTISPECIES: tyrosine-type recombinase/integrase [unclassified Variovorax]|uniref:tyrosine-type recombinase/integrase n=1 Tax=unclassified Variovorax TaxID=663243 RepID=UPI003ECDB159